VNWDKLIPWVDSEIIRRQADAFLAEHNPEGVLPLPIEEIVEFRLGINIVPLPGLQFRIGSVGFITSDLTEIDVDQEVAERYASRYRWTIAHEVGHLLLHRPLYEAQSFSTADQWKQWVGSIPDRLYRRLEAQANTIAAQMLMPARALTDHFEDVVSKLESQGLDWTVAPDMVYRILGRTFGVAPESIMYALRNEGLAEDPRANA